MSLPTTYTQAYSQFEEFFNRIRDAQAPEKFTQQILKDWGFKSNNHRPYIPLLKALNFLSSDGTPTQSYHDYRDHSKSRAVLGKNLKETYSDIFLIQADPDTSDKSLVEGKFKSYHNVSDNVAKLHSNTFYGLLKLSDLNSSIEPAKVEKKHVVDEQHIPEVKKPKSIPGNEVGLHYNIQIHLPATKDVEVYNAIFKSLKEHLIE